MENLQEIRVELSESDVSELLQRHLVAEQLHYLFSKCGCQLENRQDIANVTMELLKETRVDLLKLAIS
jgi:hypothetical protein